jgi:hypothetical protein
MFVMGRSLVFAVLCYPTDISDLLLLFLSHDDPGWQFGIARFGWFVRQNFVNWLAGGLKTHFYSLPPYDTEITVDCRLISYLFYVQ